MLDNSLEIDTVIDIHTDGALPSEQTVDTSQIRILMNAFDELYKNNESLTILVILNLLRDFPWAYLSLECLDWSLQKTDNESYGLESQWFGQQTWGTLLPLLACVCIFGLHKFKRQPELETVQDGVIYTAALATAIYTWDRGQQLGASLGQNQLKMSDQDAAYFASILTGVFEGVTQYGVISLGNLLAKPAERKKFKENLLTYLGNLGLATTIGAIPGSVWQIVFVACQAKNFDPIISSLLVALTVAACNMASTKSIEWINSAVKNSFSQQPSLVDLETEESINHERSINTETSEAEGLLGAKDRKNYGSAYEPKFWKRDPAATTVRTSTDENSRGQSRSFGG